MGHAQVMTWKIAWDNACYWGITSLLFYQGRLVDVAFMASIEPLMRRFFVLHARMQVFFRSWSEIDSRQFGPGMTSVVAHARLRELQAELGGPRVDDDALRARLEANFSWLERFAAAWRDAAVDATGDGVARLVPVGAVDPIDIDVLRLDAAVATRP